MAIITDIKALQDRTVSQLDQVYHFDAHTIWAYQVTEEAVRKDPRGDLITPTTESKHSPEEVLSFLDDYKSRYLHALSFLHTTAIFEAFIFDFARLLLKNQPRLLSGTKKIDVDLVLTSPDYSSLILSIADKELNELKYAKVADWFSYIDKLIHIGCPTKDQIERFAEIKASRDILVHNSARVNSVYVVKAGKHARYGEGDRLDIPFKYFRLSWKLVKKMATDMSQSAAYRLEKGQRPKSV
jgi:hypothetical protein